MKAAIDQIKAEGGYRKLFKGMCPILIRAYIVNAITLPLYDVIKANCPDLFPNWVTRLMMKLFNILFYNHSYIYSHWSFSRSGFSTVWESDFCKIKKLTNTLIIYKVRLVNWNFILEFSCWLYLIFFYLLINVYYLLCIHFHFKYLFIYVKGIKSNRYSKT